MSFFRPLACAALLALSLPALAQQTATTKAEPAKESEPDLATLRAMKSKVFEVKHRQPVWLASSLRALCSGVKGARLDSNDQNGLNTLTIRDFPENIAAVEEALKRLDVPSPSQKMPDVELTIQVLIASKGAVPEGGFPVELQAVVNQLKGTLAYRGYALAATFVQRVGVNGNRTVQGGGQLEDTVLPAKDPKDPSQYFVTWESDRGIALEGADGESARYFLQKFQFWLRERRSNGSETHSHIETGITLKDGDRVVVGTSVVKDKGLIVVIQAKRVS